MDNLLSFTGSCGLEFTGVGGGNIALRGAWVGDGTVNVNFLTQNASQTFSLGGEGSGGGHMYDFSGTVDFGTNRGFCRLNNNSSFNFGSSNAIFNLGTSDMTFVNRNGATTTHLGALIGGPETRLSGARNDESGTTTYSIGGKNLDTTFQGIITNGQSGSSIRPAAIIKVGTGKLTLTGASVHTGSTTIESGTLQVDGSFSSSPVIVNGGTLQGTGVLAAGAAINFGGTLSAGDGIPGQITISNSLSFASGSTNLVEINKSDNVIDNVVGLNSVSYGGTLVVSMVQGTLQKGDSFKLFDATPGNYFGTFEAIVPETPGAGLFWDTSNLTVDGTLKVIGPNPPLNMVVNGSNLDFSWTNTGTNTFKLQAQTNNLNIGISGNWGDYPGGGSSPVSVPLDATQGTVFFRLSSQ
jgi:autotransporter-associated beta strand protein